VPCDSAKLIAAIGAANSGGGARINLAPGCTYHLTAANSTDPMLGAALGRVPAAGAPARLRGTL
jgi:hypothetical protein